jgi:hypothetical protein
VPGAPPQDVTVPFTLQDLIKARFTPEELAQLGIDVASIKKAKAEEIVRNLSDFLHEKTYFQHLACKHGHRVVLGVKYQCETAQAELAWAYMSAELVAKGALDGTLQTLACELADLLRFRMTAAVVYPQWRRVARFMQLYGLGASSIAGPPVAGLGSVTVHSLIRLLTGTGARGGFTLSHMLVTLRHAAEDVDEADKGVGPEEAEADEEDCDETDEAAVDAEAEGEAEGGAVGGAQAEEAVAASAASAHEAGGESAVGDGDDDAAAAMMHLAGAGAGVAAANAAPPSTLPSQTAAKLWQLMTVWLDAAKAAHAERRRSVPRIFAAFEHVLRDAWKEHTEERRALHVLTAVPLDGITVEWALQHTPIWWLGVARPVTADHGGGSAAAGADDEEAAEVEHGAPAGNGDPASMEASLHGGTGVGSC